jgi:hypothetical protein
MLIGLVQITLGAAVALPATPVSACTPQTCPGGGGSGGGHTGGGGPPGPLAFSSYCQQPGTGGLVYPGDRDSCAVSVLFGTLAPGATVTISTFVMTNSSNPSLGPITCSAGPTAGLLFSDGNSCTFDLLNGAGGGTNIGTQSFTAPLSSARDGAVHMNAQVQEQSMSFTMGISVSGPGSFISADPSPVITMGALAMTEGQAFEGALATFTDPEPTASGDGDVGVCASSCVQATNSQYVAIVDWGDGTANAQPATIAAGNTITAAHTYTEEGSYTVTVTLMDQDTSYNIVSATATATVADAALSASGRNVNSTDPVSAMVASFTDADPNGSVSDYSGTIDWGDGSSSPATITQDGGQFDISGSHSYADLGPYQLTISVCDGGGSCAQTTSQLLVYGLSSGGNFVVGDSSAASGAPVTFWGAGWSSANALSGGASPASFKGFADQPAAAPACGASWTSTPGNSASPPSSVPSYMAVVVASSITQDGGHIAGDSPEVVVVKTDSGYGPDPSQAGTGTVVAVLCP